MPGFGTIHDLADVELRVRRVLQEALHYANCGYRLVSDEELLSHDQHEQLKELLLKTQNLIKRVIGD